MTVVISTGLRNKLLDTSPFKTLMALGFIDIYSGAAPGTADAAATGTKLVRISVASTGTGLTWSTSAASGALSKNGDVWSGVNLASGTAGYFRIVAAGDDATLSTTQARLQGECALVGGDLNLSTLSHTAAATFTLDYMTVGLPAS